MSSSGYFPNGIHARAVVQLIADYDEAAPIEAVAEYFDISAGDVSAALEWWAAAQVDGDRRG